MDKFYVSGYSFLEVLYEIFPITVLVAFALFIVGRVLVYSNFSKSIKREADKKWKLCVALLGIIGVIIYFIHNDKEENKYTKKLTITKCLSVLILDLFFAAVCFGIYNYEFFQWESYANEARCEKYIFKNADGKRVIYDKMGNEYLVDELQYDYDGIDDAFYYYTKNGDAYLFEYDIEEMEDEPRYFCPTTKDVIFSDNAYINEQGYLVKTVEELEEISIKNSNITFSKNKQGNLYFSPYRCSWDSEGNLLFNYEKISLLKCD